MTLDDWVEHLGAAIDAGPTPAFVVAHSMAGLSASQLAELRPEIIARIVYVAAVIPAEGQAALATVRELGAESHLFAPGTMEFSADGALVAFSPDRIRSVFYNRSSDEDFAWASAQMCPESVVTLMTPLALSAQRFGQIPKTYIATTDDHVIPNRAQRIMAEAIGADIVEIEADHSAFVSAVDELVKAIDGATTRIPSV